MRIKGLGFRLRVPFRIALRVAVTIPFYRGLSGFYMGSVAILRFRARGVLGFRAP